MKKILVLFAALMLMATAMVSATSLIDITDPMASIMYFNNPQTTHNYTVMIDGFAYTPAVLTGVARSALGKIDLNDETELHNPYIQFDVSKDWSLSVTGKNNQSNIKSNGVRLTVGSADNVYHLLSMYVVYQKNISNSAQWYQTMQIYCQDTDFCTSNMTVSNYIYVDNSNSNVHTYTYTHDVVAGTVDAYYDGVKIASAQVTFYKPATMLAVSWNGQSGTNHIVLDANECTPDWNPSSWSNCELVDGNYVQSRSFTDSNNCGQEVPEDEIRSCGKSNNHYGATTDFAQVADPTNIPNAVYETPYGKIAWVNPISIVGVDIDDSIIIRSDLLFVNASKVTPSMDFIADVSFQMDRTYDWCTKGFQVYYSENAYSDIKKLAEAYSDEKAVKLADKSRIGLDCFNASVCKAVTCSQSKVGFQAQHFSGFGVISESTSSPPGASGGSYTPWVDKSRNASATTTAKAASDPEKNKKLLFVVVIIGALVFINSKKKR